MKIKANGIIWPLLASLLFLCGLSAPVFAWGGCDPPCTGCCNCVYGSCVNNSSKCSGCCSCSNCSCVNGNCGGCCKCSACSCVGDNSQCDHNNCFYTCNDDCECVLCYGEPHKFCCFGNCCSFGQICCYGSCCDPECCDSWDCEHCVSGTCEPCLRSFANEEEWLACSNVVDYPDLEPTPNGCTWVPDNPTGCEHTSFESACNNHDNCYGTCNSFFSICNSQFRNATETICEALTGEEREECYDDCMYYADLYSDGVSELGAPWYNDAQVEQCACCDCN